jgi:hypothetical protein
VVHALLALTLWSVGALDPLAPLTLLVLGTGIIGLPLLALLAHRLAALTRTTAPGYLWFGALGALGLVGAMGTVGNAGLALVGLLALALAWWLVAARVRAQLDWSRIRLAALSPLLPLAAKGVAFSLGVAALALPVGLDVNLPALTGLGLAGLMGLIGAAALSLSRPDSCLTRHPG